jgi:hypothetical protein
MVGSESCRVEKGTRSFCAFVVPDAVEVLGPASGAGDAEELESLDIAFERGKARGKRVGPRRGTE